MSKAEKKPSPLAQFFSRIKWTYVIISVFFLCPIPLSVQSWSAPVKKPSAFRMSS